MGIEQIPEQIKKAPTQGLRAVFAGIGKLLMSADRPQAGASASPAAQAAPGAERGRAPKRSRARGPVVPESRWRSLDQTGNVRLLSAEDLNDDSNPEQTESEPARSKPARSEPAEVRPAATAATATAATASSPAPALPLPGYDSLSLASIRARLRGLDVIQLRILVEYESKNAERPEVLGMLERRIEKLETGT
jgi:hypothetical protein